MRALLWQRTRPLLLGLGFLLALGCSLFGGSSGFQRAGDYKVSPLREWTPHSKGESDIAFLTATGKVVTLTSSCERESETTLELLTKHLLIGTRNPIYAHQQRYTILGRAGLHSSVKTTLDGTPVFMELFVITNKQNCVFDFTMLGKSEISKQEVEQFLIYVKTLQFGKD